jgi:hypothetical protein
MDARLRALAALWFEPWVGAHASWARPGLAPSACSDGLPLSRATQRLTYRSWCREFGLEAAAPEWLRDGSAVLAELWLPRVEEGEDAATFVAAVSLASTTAFASLWTRDAAALVRAASPVVWRSAMRLARARPLLDAGDDLGRTVVTRAVLVARGLAQLRAAIEAHWPGLWERLRLRFDSTHVESAESMKPMRAGAAASEDVRYTLRAWRLGALEIGGGGA